MFSIAGKVTVITGGTSGIGRATAERFCRGGATVVLSARGDGQALAEQIGATFIQADVRNEDDVRRLMDQTVERFGRIDVSVNNAGIFTSARPLVERPASEMQLSFEVNALGPFYGMKHAVKHMRRGGVIVNTSSLGGIVGTPEYADYAASKFALHGISRSAALEFGPLGIRVNCVCPASVNTPMLTQAEAGEAEALLCRTTSALGTIIEPHEVAALIHFLAADDCPTITGQEILLDGGITAGFSAATYAAILKAAAMS